MRRREFITLIGGAATAWPLVARAQQAERMRKVGLLMGRESAPDARASVKALRQRLGELGWSEDRNIAGPRRDERARADDRGGKGGARHAYSICAGARSS